MKTTKPNTSYPDPTRLPFPQRPLLLTIASNSSSSNDPNESSKASKIPSSNSRRQSALSPSGLKHYSDNLYSLIDGGMTARKKLSYNTFGAFNPLLESLVGMQKMLITKQEVPMCKSRVMRRDIKYSLQNADEDLDIEDPFQYEGFSLNTEDPNVLEFKLKDVEEIELEEGQSHFCGNFNERIEHDFNDKMFRITLTEQDRTKTIGHVRQVEGEYLVYDHNDNKVFQVERLGGAKMSNQLVIVKRGEDGEIEKEMGSVDLGQWRTLTLEAEVVYGGLCTAKEKLLILGTVLIVMMKMQPGNMTLRRQNMDGACSVRGLWKEVIDKVRSIF